MLQTARFNISENILQIAAVFEPAVQPCLHDHAHAAGENAVFHKGFGFLQIFLKRLELRFRHSAGKNAASDRHEIHSGSDVTLDFRSEDIFDEIPDGQIIHAVSANGKEFVPCTAFCIVFKRKRHDPAGRQGRVAYR